MEKFLLKINQAWKNIFLFQVFNHLLSPYYVDSSKLGPVRDTQVNELWFLRIHSLEEETDECLINFKTSTSAMRA